MRTKSIRHLAVPAAAILAAAIGHGAFGQVQPLYNPVVTMIGDGAAWAFNGSHLYTTTLQEWSALPINTAGTSTLVSSSVFNNNTASGNALTGNYTQRYQNFLSNNPDINDNAANGVSSTSGYVFSAGYNVTTNTGTAVAAGTRSVGATAVTTAGVGTATVVTSAFTTATLYSNGYFAGIAGDNSATQFWTAGSAGSAGGLHYVDATPTNNTLAAGNWREGPEIRGGQLYCANDTTVSAIPTGAPVTSGTATPTAIIPNANGGSLFQEFAFFDDPSNASTDPNTGSKYNVAYVTNASGSNNVNLGIQKWMWNGTAWTNVYTLLPSGNTRGLKGLAGQYVSDNGSVVLFTSDFQSNGPTAATNLYQIDDPISATTNPGDTFYTLATCAANSGLQFGGVALAPVAVPEPMSLALLGLGAAGLLRRRRK